MNAKLKILCTGSKTIVELDGKTIGMGVEAIDLHHNGSGDAKLHISIDLEEFAFMPDGYFDEAVKKLEEAKPPEDHLIGRK